MSNLAVVNSSTISNASPSGSLSIQNVDDLLRISKMMTASGFFADCKDAAQAGVKIMAGLELGFPAFASLVGIQIIKGKPVMGANLQAAAIKRSGKYNYRVKVHTATNCSIEFLERFDGKWDSCGTSDFSMDDAKAAGLNTGDNWRKYPKNMLFARAVSNGVKWYCPDLFLGAPVYTPDEFGLAVNEDGDAIAPTATTVVSTPIPANPVTPPAHSNPENLLRLKAIREKTGHTQAQAKNLALALELQTREAASWTQDALNRFIHLLYADWGMSQNAFDHINHAKNALTLILPNASDDAQLWELWIADVARRKLEKTEYPVEVEAEDSVEDIANPF